MLTLFFMERSLITLTLFVSAILFGYSPLLVDSLGPEKRSNEFASPPASALSTSSRPPPARQVANHENGNNHRSHFPPPVPRTRSSHFHLGPPGVRRLPRPNGKEAAGKSKDNIGKKIGLLFGVVAGSLQIGVVLFLGIKRWQIMKMDSHSS